MPIETKIETIPAGRSARYVTGSAFGLVRLAEDAGFEPARARTQPPFQPATASFCGSLRCVLQPERAAIGEQRTVAAGDN